MLKLLSQLIVGGLIALVLFLVLGASFIQKSGNALIDAINNSAVHGLAQIIPSSSGNTSQLQINLQGLTANSHYDVTLDQDKCGGPVVQDVGLVTTDANGNVTSTFSVPDISKLTSQTLWLDVHQGPDKSSQSTACGQVKLNSTSASQVNLSGSANSTTASSSVPSGVSNSGTNSGHSGKQNTSDTGLPNSGVAPGGSDSYDNYTFPRKY